MSTAQTEQSDVYNTESLYEREYGDVIRIDGVEHVVVGQSHGMFHNPLLVTVDGNEYHSLVGGAVNVQADVAGVTYQSRVSENPCRDDLLAEFESVRHVGTDVERADDLLPHSDDRECPRCDEGVGLYLSVQRGETVRERYKCSECDDPYLYKRLMPDGDTATLKVRPWRGDDQGDVKEIEISGVFTRHGTDKFINIGNPNGTVWTASEIAEYLNPKLEGDDFFGYVHETYGGKIEWRDERIAWDVKTEFKPLE